MHRLGQTYARFRLEHCRRPRTHRTSRDGEVEDYAVEHHRCRSGHGRILPDPENPGQNMLSITGTAGNDNIAVTQLRTHLLRVAGRR